MGRRDGKLAMVLKIVGGALSRRRTRTALALLSIMVGASVAGALVAVSQDAERKVSQQLRGFGPDLMLVPRQGTTLPVSLLNSPPAGVSLAYPILYQVGDLTIAGQAQQVAVAGIPLSDALRVNPWWHLTGQLPDTPSGCLVGSRLATAYKLAPGHALRLELHGHPLALRVDGVIASGGDADREIFLALAAVQQASGLPGRMSIGYASVQGNLAQVKALGKAMAGPDPDAQARPILAIAASQGKVLGKLHGLLWGVTLLIVACAALCTGATLVASAAEREREFGLMKSLGASRSAIAQLFLTESLILGTLGGLLGYLVAMGFAQLIGLSLHDGWVPPHWLGFEATLGIALTLALGSGILGLARALAVDPAIILKGE